MQAKVEICGVNTAKLSTLKPGETEDLLRREGIAFADERAGAVQAQKKIVFNRIGCRTAFRDAV